MYTCIFICMKGSTRYHAQAQCTVIHNIHNYRTQINVCICILMYTNEYICRYIHIPTYIQMYTDVYQCHICTYMYTYAHAY